MDFVIGLEIESGACDREHTGKNLLQNKVPVFGISSAAAVWQTIWAGLCKAFWIALLLHVYILLLYVLLLYIAIICLLLKPMKNNNLSTSPGYLTQFSRVILKQIRKMHTCP